MIIYLEYAQEVLDFALAAVNAIPKDDNTGPTIEGMKEIVRSVMKISVGNNLLLGLRRIKC